MSAERGYNGWANYETWVTALWIDNEETSYRYWRKRANALEDAYDLAKELKLEFTEGEGLPGVEGLYADLLNAALSEVDWMEIAEHMKAEV